jgi:hypothetical protein
MLWNDSSSIEDVLMLIEKCPEALQHPDDYCDVPLHIECMWLSRPSVISKCIELYPQALAMADELAYLPLH